MVMIIIIMWNMVEIENSDKKTSGISYRADFSLPMARCKTTDVYLIIWRFCYVYGIMITENNLYISTKPSKTSYNAIDSNSSL